MRGRRAAAWLLLPVVLACAAAWLPRPAAAVAVLPCSLLDLCDRAGLIVQGRCVSVRDERDVRTGLPIRTVRLAAQSVLKVRDRNVSPALLRTKRLHTFRQFNSPSLYGCEGEPPSYSPGEEVVLFLAPTSRIGLTAPIGMWQGKFRVLQTGHGRRPAYLVVNARNNENLSINAPLFRTGGLTPRGVQAGRVNALRLSGWDRDILTRTASGPVDLTRFLQLVRKLVREGARA